ncbi:hypothetical protein Syun_001347 [Stephania yunnanensis]|uniref:Uncharacterized protein n=1 Tax=Stephania yunnanensis TaxID=152371 RepID=A0AAP0Q667_9MAGN
MASNGQRIQRKKSSNVDPTEQGLTTAAIRLADAFAYTDCARLQKELRSIIELSREDVMRVMLLLGGEDKDNTQERRRPRGRPREGKLVVTCEDDGSVDGSNEPPARTTLTYMPLQQARMAYRNTDLQQRGDGQRHWRGSDADGQQRHRRSLVEALAKSKLEGGGIVDGQCDTEDSTPAGSSGSGEDK